MLRRLLKRAARRLRRSETASAPPAQVPAPAAAEVPEEPPDVEIDAATALGWPDAVFVDIREPFETRTGTWDGAVLVPMNTLPDSLDRLPRDRPLVLYCAAGVRSFSVAHWLRDQGRGNAFSLIGGLPALLRASAQA